MSQSKKQRPKGSPINLESVDEHFSDLDSLASAINMALEDADKAISRKTQPTPPENEPSDDDQAHAFESLRDDIAEELTGRKLEDKDFQRGDMPAELPLGVGDLQSRVEDEGDSEDDFEVVDDILDSEVLLSATSPVVPPIMEAINDEPPAQPMTGLAEIFDTESEIEIEEEDPEPVEPVEKSETGETVAADQKQADENYERLLRVMADFDNFKKRTVREREEHQRFVNEELLKQLLPVMDNFERALAHLEQSKDFNTLLEGVQMIYRQIREILKKSGVRSVESLGRVFDPTKHQAISVRETVEVESNQVVEEFQKGYFLHDRLIRAALVVVSQTPSGAEAETGKPDREAEELEEIEPLDNVEDMADDPTQELEELEPIDET